MALARRPMYAISSTLLCAALISGCGGVDGPPDEPGTPVRLSFCAGEAPIWLAVQDGDAAWARIYPRIEGFYEARFTANRGGIAYVTNSGASLFVAYGNLTELASISCGTGFNILNGNVAGLASAEGSDIWYGQASVSVDAPNPRFQFRNAADGQQDLFTTRFTWSSGGGQIANRLVVRRAQTLTSGSRIPPIDFASTESFAPAFATASVTGADQAAEVFLNSRWHGRGSAALLMFGPAPRPLLYPAVPLDRLGPGEFSSLEADTRDQAGGRSARTYFRAPGDRVIAVGPSLNAPVVTWPDLPPGMHPRLQLQSQPEYARVASITYYQGFDYVHVAMTSAYLGGTPATWDIVVPDLSAADGWNDAWGLGAVPAINWTVAAEGGTDLSLGDTAQDGDVVMGAYLDGGEGISAYRATGRPEPLRGGFPVPPRREK